jgi:hypothetical protein
MLFGGYGHDVLVARALDNQVDFLICGPGRDIAYARPEDVIHRSCERQIVVQAQETEPADDAAEANPPAEVRLSGNPNVGATDPSDDNDPGKK